MTIPAPLLSQIIDFKWHFAVLPEYSGSREIPLFLGSFRFVLGSFLNIFIDSKGLPGFAGGNFDGGEGVSFPVNRRLRLQFVQFSTQATPTRCPAVRLNLPGRHGRLPPSHLGIGLAMLRPYQHRMGQWRRVRKVRKIYFINGFNRLACGKVNIPDCEGHSSLFWANQTPRARAAMLHRPSIALNQNGIIQ